MLNPWSQALSKWKKKTGKSDNELARMIGGITGQAVTLWRGGTIARSKLRRRIERVSKKHVRAKLGEKAKPTKRSK